jgi:hypothetical protein
MTASGGGTVRLGLQRIGSFCPNSRQQLEAAWDLAVAVTAAYDVLLFGFDFLEGQPRRIAQVARPTDAKMEVRPIAKEVSGDRL